MSLCGSDLDSGNFVKYFLVTDLRGQVEELIGMENHLKIQENYLGLFC